MRRGSRRRTRFACAVVWCCLAVALPLAIAPSAGAVAPAPTLLGSVLGAKESSTFTIDRDVGVSVALPNGKTLWVFGDTVTHAYESGSWRPKAAVTGSTAAIGTTAIGQRPTGLYEVNVGKTLTATNPPARFIPAPTKVYMPDGSGRACTRSNGALENGRWPIGAALLPDLKNVIVTYAITCVPALGTFTVEGWGFMEYNWTTNAISMAPRDVFPAATSGATLVSSRIFGSPIVYNGTVTFFSSTCCSSGDGVFRTTVDATIAALSNPASYDSHLIPGLPLTLSVSVSMESYSPLKLQLLDLTDFHGKFAVFSASSVAGPWTEETTGTLPGCANSAESPVPCSTTYGHADLSSSGQLLVSYYSPRFGPAIGTHPSTALGHVVMAAITVGTPPTPPAQSISAAGPLTNIGVTRDLACSLDEQSDSGGEFYANTSCATEIGVGGVTYGAESATGVTPVSQSAVTGSGTGGDPFTITTVADVGATGLRISETDSYAIGAESYRTDVQVLNSTGGPIGAVVYRGADCYVHNSDRGYGSTGSPSGSVACVAPDSADRDVPGTQFVRWVPLSAGSHSMEGDYSAVWSAMSSGTALPDTCDCATRVDNGAGLSWGVTVPGHGSITVSHLTVVSQLGLQFDLSAPPAIAAGDPLTFDGTVTNTDPTHPIHGITLAGSTDIAHILSQANPTCSFTNAGLGGQLSCPDPGTASTFDLAPGASIPISVTVDTAGLAGQTITFSASANSADVGGDTGTSTTPVAVVSPLAVGEGLIAAPGVTAGQDAVWTVPIVNHSAETLGSVTATLHAAGIGFNSALMPGCAAGSGGSEVCHLADIPPGGERDLRVRVRTTGLAVNASIHPDIDVSASGVADAVASLDSVTIVSCGIDCAIGVAVPGVAMSSSANAPTATHPSKQIVTLPTAAPGDPALPPIATTLQAIKPSATAPAAARALCPLSGSAPRCSGRISMVSGDFSAFTNKQRPILLKVISRWGKVIPPGSMLMTKSTGPVVELAKCKVNATTGFYNTPCLQSESHSGTAAANNLTTTDSVRFVGTGPYFFARRVVATPGVPTAVSATAGTKQATVAWKAPASSVITGYVVTAFSGGILKKTVTFASALTNQHVTGLTTGTTYTFKVAGHNLHGTGARSTASNAVKSN